jgi:hypothetical protein
LSTTAEPPTPPSHGEPDTLRCGHNKRREDQIKAHLKEAEAVKYRATVVHDSLSEADQAEATKLLFYHIVDPRGRVLSVLREGIKRNRRRAS